MDKRTKVGVIGMGSFGAAISDLLAENTDVLLYSRSQKKIEIFNETHYLRGFKLSPRITATNNLAEIGACNVIFPVVPSGTFRQMMHQLAPFLNPSKILIHGTKGFDVCCEDESLPPSDLIDKIQINHISEVILQESSVLRIGCLSGPNLAREILMGQPTATVIASEFDEVIQMGQRLLSSKRFYVFGSHDLKGAELAGVLKNIFALASGILSGKGYGKNIQAMLLTRGLGEMIALGKALGSNSMAFLGTAGIGDMIATGTSELSRNFSFGVQLGKGKPIEEIYAEIEEVVEGVRTLKFAQVLSEKFNVQVPITNMIYRVVYEGYEIDRAIHYLMKYPGTSDVDFL
jgi:glycerol-3-phosphate dehydrogenase (NAD(P)+)